MDQNKNGTLRVFIVEDESLVAMLIEDMLSELHCRVVAKATGLNDALAKASTEDFDIAILDVNLNGVSAYPIADILIGRNIPFVFLTGYGSAGLPEPLSNVPIVSKPFDENRLKKALQTALAVKT